MPSPVSTLNTRLTAGCGAYRVPQQKAMPFVATTVEVSGFCQTSQGQWLPVNRVQLDPAQTQLSSVCSCPVDWQLKPLRLD
jgi:hypothetical protein